ncbi:MAG TPA: prephenate dehydratase [Methylomirabilota bacterium]|jgi:chorismate mutase/prephenate dehydratase|nr:prephenate dehydratase [Methylomirabilota bacterium]
MGLDEWRARIDEIDRQLLRLLNQRAQLSLEIGRAKRESGESVLVPEREQEILDELARLNPGPLPPGAIRAIWSEVLSASRGLQRPFRAAYLGPQGTNTHLAALRHFGSSAELLSARGIPEVFDEVERGRADVGVVPIENSSEGVVNHTLDGLIDSELLICGEVSLEIHHHLLSRATDLGDIKRVFSHPQALAQCRGWLNRHLPDAEVVEMASTSAAAEQAALDAATAAVASELAGRLHGITLLRERIEDHANNVTRFLVIGRRAAGRTGRDKTSVLFSIRDEVGTLYRILEPFATARLSLTKIESRPTRRRPWEYVFFVDFEGHRDDPVTQGVLAAVRERCLFLKVLGSYPAALEVARS